MNKPIPFGKYYLLERINVGGMAEVYRAKAFGIEGFERLVAVKRILPNVAEDKEFIRMFIDEAKLAVELNHANIAQIFDLGMVGNDYFIALEHIHGRDLRAIFERCRELGEPMSIAQACFAVMKACEGLDYAHNKRDASGRELNLVHRDVSPQNILVSFEGGVKLIDFGIAKAAGRGSQTEAGILKGKFGYMSPEQVRGLPVDRRSDVFACGIVLYEMLTGERLFLGESDFSTLEKVRNVEILPPSTYNRRIPDELERIVLKALEKDVDDRYQSAIDLHDELQAFVYTAGEFCSRKDLASWVRGVFAREVDAEISKLEQFRKFTPTSKAPPALHRTARGRASVPPPLPGKRAPKASMPPPIPGVRKSEPQPSLSAASVAPRREMRSEAAPPMMAAAPGGALAWDDDELETEIYDNPDETSTAKEGPRALASAAVSGAIEPIAESDQDLAGLVQKARDWNAPENDYSPLPPVNTATGSTPRISITSQHAEAYEPADKRVARGTASPPAIGGQGVPAPVERHDSSAVAALAAMAQRKRSTFEAPAFDLMDRPMSARRSPPVAAMIAVAALLVGGGILAMMLVDNRDGAGVGEQSQMLAADVLDRTGFEVFVTPRGLGPEVRIDGRIWGKAPLRITKLQPGEHTIEVVAPEGFHNRVKKVHLDAGKVERVKLALEGIPRVVAIESEPEGAMAVLIGPDGKRSELGPTPTSTKIDVHRGYQVEFSHPGYESLTEKIALKAGEHSVSAMLNAAAEDVVEDSAADVTASVERAADDTAAEERRRRRRERREREQAATAATERASRSVAAANVNTTPAPERAVEAPAPREEKKRECADCEGVLLLGSKPPCEIFINGRNTGLRTPQRKIELPVGKHKVVLVNNDHGIRDAFFVKIEDGKRTKAIRDLTEKMK